MKRFLNYLLNIGWILSVVRLFLSPETNKKIDIAILRREMSFFGHDMSNWTDEEIEAGVKEVSKLISSFGLTAEEAEKAIKALSIN